MFVDHVLEALRPGRRPPFSEELSLDLLRYRGQFMAELRRRAAPAGEALVTWVRTGGFDDFLRLVADRLIELGVVREQALLDHFLHAAVQTRLCTPPPLSPTDLLLLEQAMRPCADEGVDGATRIFSRRYATQLGLVAQADPAGPLLCTDLGEAVRRLPQELVLAFLICLESSASYGLGDPWRAPGEAYLLLHQVLQQAGTLPLLPGAQADTGLLRADRLRRWLQMGICELVADGEPRLVQVSAAGARALREALRQPRSEVALLCDQVFLLSRRLRLLRLGRLSPQRGPRESAATRARPFGVTSAPTDDIPIHVALPVPAHDAAARWEQAGPTWEHAAPAWDPTANTGPLPTLSGPTHWDAAPAAPPAPISAAEAVDAEEACRAALREVGLLPGFAHVTLSLTVLPNAARCRLPTAAAGHALRRLLHDLLCMAAAAVTALPAPRVLLELAASEGEIAVLLHENGPGIPVSQRPRVFAESLKSGEPVPRYLLGPLRRVVEDVLHGRIEIAAPRLGGASFRLTLPRTQQQRAA